MSDYIKSFLIVLLEVMSCKIFFESFAEKKNERGWGKNFVIIVLLMIAIYLLASIFNRYFLIRQITVILSISLLMFLYLKITLRKSFLLAILFQGLLLAVDYLVFLLNGTVFHNITAAGEVLLIVLGKMALFMAVLIIKSANVKYMAVVIRDAEWLRLTIFPLFTIVTIAAMITASELMREALFFYVAVGLAGMNIMIFYLINGILKRETQINENKIFELQVKNQTDMYRSISENFNNQRIKTHEYKNQIMCIEALINRKNYSELEQYVNNISGNLLNEISINTNNVIINAILNSKYKEIMDKNILFVFKINDLSQIRVSDEDIVVVLSNLLNNAIEACENCPGKRFIKLKLVREANEVIISLRNTYNNAVVFKDGMPMTTKEREQEHGIGIRNIVDTITKYGGSYAISTKEKVFNFSIIIPQ